MSNQKIIRYAAWILVALSTHPLLAIASQDSIPDVDPTMLDAVIRRVKDDPQNSENWRMLGKLSARMRSNEDAIFALEQAIKIAPENAAAHFDLGSLLTQLDRQPESDFHFQQVFQIAPGSKYANQLIDKGIRPDPVQPSNDEMAPTASQAVFIGAAEYSKLDPTLGADASRVEQAGFEIQTFDGSDDLARRIAAVESPVAEKRRWKFTGETGVLYNSNVTLTPISRELASSADAASAQWFANPDFEWTVKQTDAWRSGIIGRGFFTVNDSSLSNLNLSSFHTGAFLEKNDTFGDDQRISRLEYMYAIDQFDGKTIGDRHSLTASVMKIKSMSHIDYAYARMATSNFFDDGPAPAVSSLDGDTYAIGISRFFLTSNQRLPTWSMGLDLESANTEGADFRYFSVRFFGDATIKLSDKVNWINSAGMGLRTYPDFTGSVARDEFTWRAGSKLQYRISPRVTISAVTNYDRFQSDNVNFDVDRFTAGIVTTLQY